MTRSQICRVVLEFPDEEVFAASFRLQRSLIPATARGVGLATSLIDQRANVLAGFLLAGEKLVFDTTPANLCRIQVNTVVQQTIRTQDLFTVEKLGNATREAEEALRRLPIPDVPWFGPAHDPWLATWASVSPLLMHGLGVLARDVRGDEFITADSEVWHAVSSAAQKPGTVRGLASQIVGRVGHAGSAPRESGPRPQPAEPSHGAEGSGEDGD
jgi:hypothetical protein